MMADFYDLYYGRSIFTMISMEEFPRILCGSYSLDEVKRYNDRNNAETDVSKMRRSLEPEFKISKL